MDSVLFGAFIALVCGLILWAAYGLGSFNTTSNIAFYCNAYGKTPLHETWFECKKINLAKKD